MGLLVPPSGVVTFQVHEADPRWQQLSSWVDYSGAVDIVTTEFSSAELAAAEWLKLVSDWHHGYPQPEEGAGGYRATTYAADGGCVTCGIGRRQVAPFQMKGEPRWGARGILQLNWVFDEFFVKPEVWSSVFQPAGIEFCRAASAKGGNLETVVQLVIDDAVNIATDSLSPQKCDECGQHKYLPQTRGYFPAIKSDPSGHAVKTIQYFGSGFSAHRGVLVSQSLRQALIRHNIKGASFWPTGPAV